MRVAPELLLVAVERTIKEHSESCRLVCRELIEEYIKNGTLLRPDPKTEIKSKPLRGTDLDRPIKAFNETKSLRAWLSDNRVSADLALIRRRLRAGWEPAQAVEWQARGKHSKRRHLKPRADRGTKGQGRNYDLERLANKFITEVIHDIKDPEFRQLKYTYFQQPYGFREDQEAKLVEILNARGYDIKSAHWFKKERQELTEVSR